MGADPYRCDCGAELDHPGADCDACGARGTDTPERDDPEADSTIDAMARASEARQTGRRTLWSFRSSDGEGEVQQVVACAACGAGFTVKPGVTAVVADDDLACSLCGAP